MWTLRKRVFCVMTEGQVLKRWAPRWCCPRILTAVFDRQWIQSGMPVNNSYYNQLQNGINVKSVTSIVTLYNVRRYLPPPSVVVWVPWRVLMENGAKWRCRWRSQPRVHYDDNRLPNFLGQGNRIHCTNPSSFIGYGKSQQYRLVCSHSINPFDTLDWVCKASWVTIYCLRMLNLYGFEWWTILETPLCASCCYGFLPSEPTYHHPRCAWE